MPSSDTQRYYLPLLQAHVPLPAQGSVLEMGYYDVQGALWAASGANRVVALRPSIDLVADLDRRASAVGLTNLEARLAVRPEPAEHGTYDVALLLAPYFLGNAPVREALEAAAAALTPAGALFFQVHRRRGGDTFIDFARALFGDVTLLDKGGGQRRLLRATVPRPPASSLSASQAVATPPLEISIRGITLRLRLAAGVFSGHRIDPGSQLLAQTVELPPGARFLDLGCGAGTIGLALGVADRRSQGILVDNSRPAVELAQENATTNALDNVEVRLSDGYATVESERFDVIVSNLPAHRGHRADRSIADAFITGAPAHLRAGGTAWFVANRSLPYEPIAAQAFREVRVAAEDKRYKVLHCLDPITKRPITKRPIMKRSPELTAAPRRPRLRRTRPIRHE
ncbi:MAG: class I SAM-dependent methyltransferase [Chloroflexota bacterium]|nr:class I SAM-dependent methyltransferase [Chloroflexota bacterium]